MGSGVGLLLLARGTFDQWGGGRKKLREFKSLCGGNGEWRGVNCSRGNFECAGKKSGRQPGSNELGDVRAWYLRIKVIRMSTNSYQR